MTGYSYISLECICGHKVTLRDTPEEWATDLAWIAKLKCSKCGRRGRPKYLISGWGGISGSTAHHGEPPTTALDRDDDMG